MNSKYRDIEKKLQTEEMDWLVTGCAGFIGSHLVERLLTLNQYVIGVDNLSTGFRENIDKSLKNVGHEKAKNFEFHEIDICNFELLSNLVIRADYILHQAAIGSVPRSIIDPLQSHKSNVDGFCNILVAASKSNKISKVVYASSSSVYGTDESMEKLEETTGKLLSPYALTKKTNEIYADVFSRTYSIKTVGLRYFNVFGPRQSINGPYSAVIPKWINSLKNSQKIIVYGDGKTSRDFCYIENVIQANLLAAMVKIEAENEVFNIALNRSTSLNDLLDELIAISGKNRAQCKIEYHDFRKGDIRHSCANIDKAISFLGYFPDIYLKDGLLKTFQNF